MTEGRGDGSPRSTRNLRAAHHHRAGPSARSHAGVSQASGPERRLCIRKSPHDELLVAVRSGSRPLCVMPVSRTVAQAERGGPGLPSSSSSTKGGANRARASWHDCLDEPHEGGVHYPKSPSSGSQAGTVSCGSASSGAGGRRRCSPVTGASSIVSGVAMSSRVRAFIGASVAARMSSATAAPATTSRLGDSQAPRSQAP
jgi:hypothetical protein